MQVVRLRAESCAGAGTSKKRACTGFNYRTSEAQHSCDGPMAGHDDAHLSSTTHQQNLETRPKL